MLHKNSQAGLILAYMQNHKQEIICDSLNFYADYYRKIMRGDLNGSTRVGYWT